jgi:ubiquinone/menaquinone biosynthesis C-methylase UbiE
VLFYDVLRSVKRRKDLLEEAHRILKPDGILLVRQSRMRDDRVKDIVLKDGFFTFMGNHGRSMKFRKIEGSFHEVS